MKVPGRPANLTHVMMRRRPDWLYGVAAIAFGIVAGAIAIFR